MQGKYITIEGIDGSGKTTLAKNLAKAINELDGQEASVIREPWNPTLKEAIKYVKQLEPRHEDEILANLFAADRLILKDTIFNLLYGGTHVISDRSKYSSYAYQNLDMNYNTYLNQYMIDPDVILYLDISPEIAKSRYSGKDKFENTVTLKRVREWYRRNLPIIAQECDIAYAELEVEPYDADAVTGIIMNGLKELRMI